jgi:hypothetical protein
MERDEVCEVLRDLGVYPETTNIPDAIYRIGAAIAKATSRLAQLTRQHRIVGVGATLARIQMPGTWSAVPTAIPRNQGEGNE